MEMLRWFIIAFIALFIMWAATGGSSRIENKDNPFLEQPNPIEGGRIYNLEELKNRTRP